MMHLTPLWADGDWIRLIVPIVMFSVWVLNRLLGGDSPVARQAKARAQARVKPPQPPADQQRVNDEVGEFLRRAAQQKAAKENRPAAPAIPPGRAPKSARRSLVDRPEKTDAASESSLQAGRPGAPLPSFEDAIRSRRLPDRAAPKEVEQAVEALESHLEQTFRHQVGSLADSGQNASTTAPGTITNTPAAHDVTVMLRDPASVRDAIIVSEILRRPVERW